MAALVWTQQLPPKVEGGIARNVVTACVQPNGNGKDCADWLQQQDTFQAWALVRPLLYTWSYTGDSASAAAWCMQTPKNLRVLAFFSVGDGWGEKDPAAATAWALQLASEDDRLSAIRGVVMRWGQKDIPAVTAWIKQLKPEEVKTAAKTIAANWLFNKFNTGGKQDEAAIKEWLNQLPLSDADKEEVLKGPPLPIIYPKSTGLDPKDIKISTPAN
jgi:hypothetical protein